jgi:hypothetical protein
MNILEALALIALLLVLAWMLPEAAEDLEFDPHSAAHEAWVREQCARPDLTDDEITACRNYFGANK